MSAASTPGPGWRNQLGRDRFGPVLALLMASLVVGAVLPARLSALAVAALGVALWLAVARAASVARGPRIAGVIAFVALTGVTAAAAATDSDRVRGVANLIIAGAIAGLAAVIVGALVRERVVTMSTVAGVLSLYLLIGVFFSQAYTGILDLAPGAFTSAAPLDRFALLYFSFIALTTVGFGDITPAIDLTRALAATEAVLGQLFLVTVVARVVSLIGLSRSG